MNTPVPTTSALFPCSGTLLLGLTSTGPYWSLAHRHLGGGELGEPTTGKYCLA
jgi:hypothetical protein